MGIIVKVRYREKWANLGGFSRMYSWITLVTYNGSRYRITTRTNPTDRQMRKFVKGVKKMHNKKLNDERRLYANERTL